MTMDLRLIFVSILFFVKYSSEKVDNGEFYLHTGDIKSGLRVKWK